MSSLVRPTPTELDATIIGSQLFSGGIVKGSKGDLQKKTSADFQKKTSVDFQKKASGERWHKKASGDWGTGSSQTNKESTKSGTHSSFTKHYLSNGTASRRNVSSGSQTLLDPRFVLDSRDALKAFRLIGGFDGIQLEELRAAATKVRDEQVRMPLEKQLATIFAKFDQDGNGMLDVLEFERMVHSSGIMQKAMYDLLEQAEDEERNEFMVDDELDNGGILEMMAKPRRFVNVFSVLSTLLYVLVLAVQTDFSPKWVGWVFVELGFVILFTAEIVIRFCAYSNRYESFCGSVRKCSQSDVIFHFLTKPVVLLDLTLVILGWMDMVVILLSWEAEPDDVRATLRWFRILRVARCARLTRVFWYVPGLRILVETIWSGMKAAVWGIALIFLIVFVWALCIRTAVANEWASDGVALTDAFSNMPDSFYLVFRCMALSADGSCIDKRGIPMPSDQKLGWIMKVLWMASETFILLGILNCVLAVFVVQSAENANRIRESINQLSYSEDRVRLQKLDKLLRTLVHPGRAQSNPKDRNAAEVATMIRTEHPDAAARIPNLETQLVHFAKNIQDAKKLHQSAMDVYEAKEVMECKQLKNIPCAKTYVVNGEELLLVDDIASCNNSLGLAIAPFGATEIMLVQEQEDLDDLLEEAFEVQQFVKSVILPHTEWADEIRSGSSGNVWKQSKGLSDECIDPGIKSLERIEKKVAMKYGGRYNRNRDYARLSFIYNSVAHMTQAIPKFLDFRLHEDGIQIMTIENRFLHPHPLGWRDMTMLAKVIVPRPSEKNSLGTEDDDDDEVSYHIMEFQLRLKGLSEVCHAGHKFYEEIRAHLPDTSVTTILDRLVTDTTLDLGITKPEWLQCLPNKEVKKLLFELNIPRQGRKQLFDIIDIDGSGTVTSSELQEMLLLFKAPVHAHELAGCHSRVRDIQRQIQTKLEPQISMMHSHIVRCMEANEELLEDLFLKINESINRATCGIPPSRPETPSGKQRSSTLSAKGRASHIPAPQSPHRLDPPSIGSRITKAERECSLNEIPILHRFSPHDGIESSVEIDDLEASFGHDSSSHRGHRLSRKTSGRSNGLFSSSKKFSRQYKRVRENLAMKLSVHCASSGCKFSL